MLLVILAICHLFRVKDSIYSFPNDVVQGSWNHLFQLLQLHTCCLCMFFFCWYLIRHCPNVLTNVFDTFVSYKPMIY